PRRTDSLAADLYLVDLVGRKAKFFAHFTQKPDVAAAVFAKRKSLTKIDLFRVQAIVDNIVEKIIGGLSGKIFVEGYHDGLFYTEHLKICETLIKRLQQGRGGFGMQHRTRVRIERNGCRNRSDRFRSLDDRFHYPLMPQMQTVKNAKRQ